MCSESGRHGSTVVVWMAIPLVAMETDRLLGRGRSNSSGSSWPRVQPIGGVGSAGKTANTDYDKVDNIVSQ